MNVFFGKKFRHVKFLFALSLFFGACIIGIVVRKSDAPMKTGTIVWAGTEGIYSSSQRDNTKLLAVLKAKNGKSIRNPIFCITNATLCYWSPNDRMICIKQKNLLPVWIGIAASNDEITSIQPTQTGFLIDLIDGNYKPIQVLLLDVRKRSLIPIANIVSARSTGTNSTIIGMTASKQLQTYPSQDANFPNITLPEDSKWDANLDERCCCFAIRNRITVVYKEQRSSWSIGRLYYIHDLVIRSEKDQIWVSVDKPFGTGSKVLAFDYQGGYLGEVLKDSLPIRSPILSIPQGDVLSLMQ